MTSSRGTFGGRCPCFFYFAPPWHLGCNLGGGLGAQSMITSRTKFLFSSFILALLTSSSLTACRISEPTPLDDMNNGGSATRAAYADGWSELKISSGSFNNRDLIIDEAGHFHYTLDSCLRDSYGSMELKDWNIIASAMNHAVKIVVPVITASPSPSGTPGGRPTSQPPIPIPPSSGPTGSPTGVPTTVPTGLPTTLPTSNPRPIPTTRPISSPRPAAALAADEPTTPTAGASPTPLTLCFPAEGDGIWRFDGTAELVSTGEKRMLLESKGAEVCTSLDDLEAARELYRALSRAVTRAAFYSCPENRP